MKSFKDPRHIARIISAMDLYKHFFGEDPEEFDYDTLELGNFSTKLRDHIVPGVKEHYEAIDKIIDEYSLPVKTSDLNSLLLQIIRIAIFEGFISKSVPPKVAVDEAIEMARDFGMEDSARKTGGILGKIFDNLASPEEKEKHEKDKAEKELRAASGEETVQTSEAASEESAAKKTAVEETAIVSQEEEKIIPAELEEDTPLV